MSQLTVEPKGDCGGKGLFYCSLDANIKQSVKYNSHTYYYNKCTNNIATQSSCRGRAITDLTQQQ